MQGAQLTAGPRKITEGEFRCSLDRVCCSDTVLLGKKRFSACTQAIVLTQLLCLTRLSLSAAQKDHIVFGTDNYFTSSLTKWDQHIGERPPRTRGVPGMCPMPVNVLCIHVLFRQPLLSKSLQAAGRHPARILDAAKGVHKSHTMQARQLARMSSLPATEVHSAHVEAACNRLSAKAGMHWVTCHWLQGLTHSLSVANFYT